MKRALAQDQPEWRDEAGPRTIAESAYRALRDDILWGRLKPEAPLKFDEMRARYEYGVSPLREALMRLASERLVTFVGQKGFRVAPLTSASVTDTLSTRLIIEREALTRSIKAGDLAWEMALVSAFHGLSRHPTPNGDALGSDKWAFYHRRFHFALLAACNSSWQLEFAGVLFDQAERHRVMRARMTAREVLDRDIQAEHTAIFEAAIARDVPKATEALDRHYTATADQVLGALADQDEEPSAAPEHRRRTRVG